VIEPLPRLVGMVHLLPLPGSPQFGGSIDEVLSTAAEDARVLVDAGFPALMVENFGDVPFFAEHVPPETVAAMTLAVDRVARLGVPVGVNVLRNDTLAALGIAVATGARFVRVNVLTGVMYTDQGPIVGRAADVQRRRRALCPDVEVWADVMVKHATAPDGLDARQTAIDTAERGLADALIVSGSGTGKAIDVGIARDVRRAVADDIRVVAGSGVATGNIDPLLEWVDTILVGSSIKADANPNNRPDPLRAKAFVETAAERGLV
jgi:membrane complex biogenesis BtpA family protein